jgi:hypothetical protein
MLHGHRHQTGIFTARFILPSWRRGRRGKGVASRSLVGRGQIDFGGPFGEPRRAPLDFQLVQLKLTCIVLLYLNFFRHHSLDFPPLHGYLFQEGRRPFPFPACNHASARQPTK